MKKKLFKSKKNYTSEHDGQIQFFSDLRINAEVELTHNTDGVYKGTLFEFKLTIPDINKVLSQAIKYLNYMRVNGEPIPAQILLVALNEEKAYVFNSGDFLSEIETPCAGAASKNNVNFSTKSKHENIDYSNISGLERIIEILKKVNFTKVHINLFDVVGWANKFYRENPNDSKIKFFEELRAPNHFKDYIYPWTGDEKDFQYIMDLLNDKQHKKELGAFYTPRAYCLKAVELVRKAIKQIPAGNDYIILDRCAGTGNLEEFLNDDELSHTIINTYELKEWVVLDKRFGHKVKMIIPPPVEVTGRTSLVNGGDALSEQFILGKAKSKMSQEYINSIAELNSYIADKKTNIILFENPPYRDSSGDNSKIKEYKTQKSFVYNEFKKHIKHNASVRELSNLFIWSGWKYYLTKPNDCYVLFSPVKYWKSLGLTDKKFIGGFLFNRKHFHAGESSISCIAWKNENKSVETLMLKAFDISNQNILDSVDNTIIFQGNININKAHKSMQENFADKRIFSDDDRGLVGDAAGYEMVANKIQHKKALYNKNIVGHLRIQGFSIAPMNVGLTTIALNTAIEQTFGFYLRSDNFIEKLPLFAAKLYPQKNWYEKDVYFTTADGGDRYLKDKDFLKSCFIFTCLSQKNHCRSFEGSDKRFYKNELCFDKNTLASSKLKDYKCTKEEQDLLDIFSDVLKKSRSTKNYNKTYTYGTYQIDKELNTRNKNDNDEWIYDYPELNTAINSLKTKLAKYYESTIQPKLFKYELLK